MIPLMITQDSTCMKKRVILLQFSYAYSLEFWFVHDQFSCKYISVFVSIAYYFERLAML